MSAELNMNDLPGHPAVDGSTSFFRRLHDDSGNGSLHIIVDHSTWIDTEAVVEVLKQSK